MADWRFEVCDRDGSNAEEIVAATARAVTIPLNGGRTASFTVRLDSRQAERVLALDGDLLKVYRNNLLLFCGPLVTAEESSAEGGGTIAVTAADAMWRLTHRLLGKGVDANGRGVGYGEGTALSQVEKGLIMRHVVETANGEADTGIRIGSINSASLAYVGPWYFKPASEALVEVASTLDGPDWDLVPSEPTPDAAGVKVATFNTYTAKSTSRIDGQVDAVIFEYGIGKCNVADYKRPRSASDLLNKGWSLPAGFPDAHPGGQVPIANTYDASASIAAHGLHEGLVSEDLTVDAFRQQLVNEHVRIRRVPRETIVFTPRSNSEYDYGSEFIEGDLVTARAVVNGTVRFDVSVRVYVVGFNVDDEANERMDLVLIAE